MPKTNLYLQILFLTFFLVFLYSCKAKKPIIQNVNVPLIESKSNNFYDKIKPNFNFEYLKVKGHVKADFGTSLPEVNCILYFENDSKIWSNVSFSLFPIARALLTKDSVKLYEKINKTFINKGYSALNEFVGIDFLDLKSTQQLLLGKQFLPLNKENYLLDSTNNNYTLKSINNINIQSGKTKGSYKVQLDFDKEYEIEKIYLLDSNTNKSWEIEYSDREIFNTNNFPKKVKIIIKDKKNKEITLEYNTFEFEKMETPFTIPSHYNKREL